MDKQKTGIAWYRAEQWERLREISVDRNNLEKTHIEWLQVAEEMLMKLSAEGFDVVRYEVDVELLLKYCKDHKIPINGNSRSRYVTEMLLKQSP
jgi:hypothetical protein